MAGSRRRASGMRRKLRNTTRQGARLLTGDQRNNATQKTLEGRSSAELAVPTCLLTHNDSY